MANLFRVVLFLLPALAGAVRGQNLYRFTIDQDALAGAPDFCFLNRPLTEADALIARDGHFYRVGDGQRVRLMIHSGYEFRPAIDGAPPIPPGATFPFLSKPVHIFQPRMVELQALYTTRVLEGCGSGTTPS
jgi:hypothetical protein